MESDVIIFALKLQITIQMSVVNAQELIYVKKNANILIIITFQDAIENVVKL